MLSSPEIELRHIQLELENGRAQHLRHFIDQYFCYRHDYVSKTGKAAWNKIFWNEWVSDDANKTRNRKNVVKEHVIPLNVVTRNLVDLGIKITIDQIANVIDDFVIISTITKEEDKRLNDNGLRFKMPEAYYDQKSELYHDKFARYKIVDIPVKYVR